MHQIQTESDSMCRYNNETPHPEKWYSSEPEVVKPEWFSGKIDVKDAILVFTKSDYNYFIDSCSYHPLRVNFPGAIEGKRGLNHLLVLSSFGAPAAGMLIESLIASGIRRIFMVGEAGSISPDVKIGKIFVPTWGLREEGTSYHYLPPKVIPKPSAKLLNKLREAFKDVEFAEGGIWSIDAPFRETREKILRYSKMGVVGVDMECTALMAISMHRKVEFAAVLLITDELSSGKWVQGWKSHVVKRSKEILVQRLLKLLGKETGNVKKA